MVFHLNNNWVQLHGMRVHFPRSSFEMCLHGQVYIHRPCRCFGHLHLFVPRTSFPAAGKEALVKFTFTDHAGAYFAAAAK